MIHYNDPKYQQERTNVKPLNVEELYDATQLLNSFTERTRAYAPHELTESITSKFQRLIWDYENLQHMRETHEAALQEKYDEGFDNGYSCGANNSY